MLMEMAERGIERGAMLRSIDRILRQHDDFDSCAADCCGCFIMNAEELAQFYRCEYDRIHKTNQAKEYRDSY